MSEPVDDFLVHYGVRGMKWGKRNSKDTLTKVRVSKEDKREAKTNFKKYADPIIEKRVDQWVNSEMSKGTYDALSTKDVKFKKGMEFARVSTRKDETLRDMTYVSYLKEDRVRYRAVMPNHALNGIRKNYEYTYQATKDLRSPSEKARVDAFIELMDTPTIKAGRKEITGRELLKRQGYGRDVKTMTSQQLGLKHYTEFAGMQVVPSSLNTAYFNSLKAKGYNSLMDDNDRGVVSKAPLIILDPSGSVKRMSVRQLSSQDIFDAKKNITTVL